MRAVILCLLIAGCSSAPVQEEAELNKYTRPLGDKIWYCETRGIQQCGWADRRDVEKMIYTLYRW